jgi:AcrR family transcriptional regulator
MAHDAKERILATASDLFYRQGYRATGINQILAESGVAKASLYDHFDSKDDILHEYLRETASHEIVEMRREVAAFPTPEERYVGALKILIPWIKETDFRGCPFQNILAEAPPGDPRIRQVARRHHENIRTLLRELTEDLVASRPDLSHIDPAHVADQYFLLLEGAIALAAAYRDLWPVDSAIRGVQELVMPK